MSMTDIEVVARQARRMEAEGGIGGWKLMLTTPYSATPVGAARCVRSGGDWAAGALRIEVELALVMGRDLPPSGAEIGRDAVVAAIGSGCLAIEVLRAERLPVEPMELLADGLWNEAIVAGDTLAAWADGDVAALALELTVDGVESGRAAAGAGRQAVLDGMVWLANHAARHFGGLRAGQVVITGARIGPIAQVGAGSVAALGPGGAGVAVRLM